MEYPKPGPGEGRKTIEERLEELFADPDVNDAEAEAMKEVFTRGQHRLRYLEISYGQDRARVLSDMLTELLEIKRRERDKRR